MAWFAQKVEADGYTFDSKREYQRYRELKLMQAAGEIACLEVHPRFELANAVVVDGRKKRALRYTADFQYIVREPDYSRHVIEDVKSPRFRTAAYRMRKHLMKAVLGLDITEVE